MAGRPKAQPALSPEQVEELAAIGCADDEIAAVAGVGEMTLRRHFDTQLKTGRAHLRLRLRRLQFGRAEQGDTGMLIWLGKVYLKQSDRQVAINVDVSQLSDAELDAILKS